MVITIFKEMKFYEKRLLSLFSVFFLLVSLFSVNINNIHAKESSVIQPRLPLCTSCFKGTVTTTKKLVNKSYEMEGSINCIHGKPKGYDYIYYDTYQYTQTCSNCGYLGSYPGKQARYECHGVW